MDGMEEEGLIKVSKVNISSIMSCCAAKALEPSTKFPESFHKVNKGKPEAMGI